MKIIELNKEELNGYLIKQAHSVFLQSWEWGEFQKSAGHQIFRLGFEENGEIISAFTLIKKSLPLGMNYLYCSKFEIRKSGNQEIVLKTIREIARKEKCIFLRFEAGKKFQIPNSPPKAGQPRAGKFQIKKTIDVQPSRTLILDIARSEDEILKQMHPKTRYNIRLAAKKGVKTRLIASPSTDEFESFWRLMLETVKRDGFRLHGKEYYKKMLFDSRQQKTDNRKQSAKRDMEVKLLIAEYQDKIIAGNIVAFFGDTATYVHGASANEQRNLMAPYALQWEAIRKAKELGCRYYDFYGIDEVKWPGVTRFKKGFLPAGGQGAGEELEYPGTFDMVFDSALFWVYNVFRWTRRKISKL